MNAITVTVDPAELERRLHEAYENDKWLTKLKSELVALHGRRNEKVDAIPKPKTTREAWKLLRAFRKLRDATRSEKAAEKKITKRKTHIKRLVKARLIVETAKQIRISIKL